MWRGSRVAAHGSHVTYTAHGDPVRMLANFGAASVYQMPSANTSPEQRVVYVNAEKLRNNGSKRLTVGWKTIGRDDSTSMSGLRGKL